MSIDESIIMTLLCIDLLILVRNRLVFHYRMRVLNEASRQADLAIDRGEPWEPYFEEYAKYSYESMLFDLTKWRYRSFYPKLPPSKP